MILALMLACAAPTPDDTVAPPEPCGNPCVLEDADNFSYAADLTVEVQPLREQADATIDWSGLDVDIQGHALDPTTDIDQVRLVMFADHTPEDVADALASDTLQQSDVAAYLVCDAGGRTSCNLSEFGILGSTPGVEEYFLADMGAWLLAAQTFDVPGARGLTFVEPTAGVDDEAAVIDPATADLQATADLTSAAPVLLDAGTDTTLDWSGLTRNGLGDDMQLQRIDLLQVARYDLSASELEERFFDIEQLALDTWTLDVTGETSAVLSDLEEGSPFPGVDAQSTWLLALRCSTCDNPVPRFMTVLTAE